MHAGGQRQPYTLRPLCHQQTQRRRPQRRPGGGTCVFSIRPSAFPLRSLPIVSGADLAALGIKANPTAATAAVPSELRRSIAVIRFSPVKTSERGRRAGQKFACRLSLLYQRLLYYASRNAAMINLSVTVKETVGPMRRLRIGNVELPSRPLFLAAVRFRRRARRRIFGRTADAHPSAGRRPRAGLRLSHRGSHTGHRIAETKHARSEGVVVLRLDRPLGVGRADRA